MSRLIAVCGPRDMVSEIARRMTERQMRHMLIMEDGRMLGIVSIGDVVNSRVQAAERESRELKAYIAS
jgi:CBS domain-containing protein